MNYSVVIASQKKLFSYIMIYWLLRVRYFFLCIFLNTLGYRVTKRFLTSNYLVYYSIRLFFNIKNILILHSKLLVN